MTSSIMLLVLSAGCMIVPHRTEVSGAVSGCIINERTREPVANVRVRYYRKTDTDYFTVAHSNDNGIFNAKPIYQWHWILFIGSPGSYPFPLSIRWHYRPYCFYLDADGFEPKQVRIDSFPDTQLVLCLTPTEEMESGSTPK